ncbi:MAG: AMP-binding protein [Acetobacteraceae bacterium]
MRTGHFSHILSHLHDHSLRTPDKPFVILRIGADRRQITFRDAWRDVAAAQAAIARAGVPPDGVALLFMPQGWEALAWYFGAIAHGCTASFMPGPSAKQDPDLYWQSHVKLMQRITPSCLITTDHYDAQIQRNGLLTDGCRMVRVRPLDPAAAPDSTLATGLEQRTGTPPILQHSSGTTGLKKGVMLSHDAILTQVATYADAIEARADDVIVSWLPLYHDMGLVACSLMPMILGQTIVLLDPFEWVARPATLMDAIDAHRGTLCWLPNFAFDHLARTVDPASGAFRLDSIRAFINCSEPCQALSFRRFADRFRPAGLSDTALHVCYAMAETTFAVTQTPITTAPTTLTVDRVALHEQGRVMAPADPTNATELLSAGVPIEGTGISIVDDAGQSVADDVVGEVCIRSRSLFSGYFRLPEMTAERLTGTLYRSRDRGFRHDGQLYVLGRLDDLVIVAGRNFHAAEVETILNGVAGLKPGRNVVFGIPNAERGTNDLVAVAEVEKPEDADRGSAGHRALRAAVRHAMFQSLGIYPAEVRLVETGWLIKTTSGKIERGRNAEKYLRDKTQPQAQGVAG